jgi:hypothetical protein
MDADVDSVADAYLEATKWGVGHEIF